MFQTMDNKKIPNNRRLYRNNRSRTRCVFVNNNNDDNKVDFLKGEGIFRFWYSRVFNVPCNLSPHNIDVFNHSIFNNQYCFIIVRMYTFGMFDKVSVYFVSHFFIALSINSAGIMIYRKCNGCILEY